MKRNIKKTVKTGLAIVLVVFVVAFCAALFVGIVWGIRWIFLDLGDFPSAFVATVFGISVALFVFAIAIQTNFFAMSLN